MLTKLASAISILQPLFLGWVSSFVLRSYCLAMLPEFLMFHAKFFSTAYAVFHFLNTFTGRSVSLLS